MTRRVDPEVAVAEMLAAGVEPLEPYVNTQTPWRSRCLTCENEVAPRLGNVRSGQGACWYCGGTAPVKPEVAVAEMLAAGVEPLEKYRSSVTPWRSRCLTCENEIAPTLHSIRSGQGGCRYCGSDSRSESLRLESDVAIAAMLAAGVEPLESYVNTRTPWRSRCLTCEREVTPRLGDIRGGQGGCVHCGGRAPVDPEVATADMLAAGVKPLEPYHGAGEPWLSRCLTCGYEVSPMLASVRSGQRGCRFCAAGGFDGSEPAALYLIRHDTHRALKIGISNDVVRRLEGHEDEGWSLVRSWEFDLGSRARFVESFVLEAWGGYERAVGPEGMPQGGHTETVSLTDVNETEALTIIETSIQASDPDMRQR